MAAPENGYAPGAHPDLPPPVTEVGVIGWLRQNLFSSPGNIALTVLSVYILYLVVPPAVHWLFLDATWSGTSKKDCVSDGACWVFIRVRFDQFIYGLYPEAQRWRINTAVLMLVAGFVPMFIPAFRWKAWLGAFLLFVYPVIAYYLMLGGTFGLPKVETPLWGGLHLTLVVAAVGIVVSLPLGVVMALGRRSEMPVVRGLCTGYIEFIRGVPLITILFMASNMLPLFFPEGVNFDKLLRALIGVALFWAAYMAEVVRGGLQAIPRGQYESAAALGLGYWRMMALIILPQALKHVIPGIVSTFISLFKDTTLVYIIGIFDLLGIVQAAANDPEWLGSYKEGYVFVGLCFWVFCFSMSRYSLRLEKKLETGY